MRKPAVASRRLPQRADFAQLVQTATTKTEETRVATADASLLLEIS
jgi:hypothetical protein